MRHVVSVRLREDVVKEMDEIREKFGIPTRTDFVKLAIQYYLSKKIKVSPTQKVPYK